MVSYFHNLEGEYIRDQENARYEATPTLALLIKTSFPIMVGHIILSHLRVAELLRFVSTGLSE